MMEASPFSIVAFLSGTIFMILKDMGADFGVRVGFKCVPVLCMALWLYARTSRSSDDASSSALRNRFWTLCGLFLSAIADGVIEHWEGGKPYFLGGVGIFLLAHVCYILAFLGGGLRVHVKYLPLFVVWGSTVMTLIFPQLDGVLRTCVPAYVATIMTMGWMASSRAMSAETPQQYDYRSAAVSGAVIFAISDMLIAFRKFHVFPAVDECVYAYPIMLTYWLGQSLISYSAVEGF